MKSYCGNIVEFGRETIKTIIETLSFKAFAEESSDDKGDEDKGGDDNSSKSSTPTINYEDLIAKARKEEKDKQYKTIEKLKTEKNTLVEQHNNDLVKIASLEEQVKSAKDKLTKASEGDSKEVETLKSEIAELKKTNEDLEKKVQTLESTTPVSREEVEKEVRAELEKEYEVKTYKATKLAELKDELLVPELVFGNSVEEIDKSIEQALAKSAEIKNKLGVDSTNNTPKKRIPKAPSNPSVSSVQDNKSALEKFASVDVRSPEYAQLRHELGLDRH